jgi:EAL domain-containing protein (putative c-di-GMP-specific phosphodiesterase class I)
MRWHHQQRGAISPEAFIPVFEKSGLILPLSRWALKQACSDAASWTTALTVAVNLSPLQFTQQDLPELVASALASTGLPPERLELEMTEAALLADPAGARSTLMALAALGVKIALDDFGTGDSAPSYLRDFPFSKLKIDPSFVANIEHSASARWIIHTLVELGHSLGLTVAAEGIETASQHDYLIEQGCDLMQGFLLGRPASIETFAPLTGNLPAPVSPFRRMAPPPFAVSRRFEETARVARRSING